MSAAHEARLEEPLPHSADSERAILGSILLDNALIKAAALLNPADFYLQAHRHIFAAMLALASRGANLNAILLGEELRRAGLLEAVGGVAAITQLSYGLPSRADLSDYIEIVREKSAFRQFARLGAALRARAHEADGTAAEAARWLQDELSALETTEQGLFTGYGMNEWLKLAATKPVPPEY
jgi:replicative DNA helicase